MYYDFEKICKVEKDDFISSFGYYTKIINRQEIPEFVDYSFSLGNQYIYDKIYNELNFYMVKCRKQKLGELISVLFRYEDFQNKIVDEFDFWKKLIVPSNVLLILKELRKTNKCNNLIVENIGVFLENINSNDLEQKIIYELFQIPEAKQIIESLKKQQETLGEYHFLKKLNIGTLYHLLYYSKLDEIKRLFNVFSNNQLDNVSFLANGSTSSVFLVNSNSNNDFIIKIGKERHIFNVQYSPYLLQPYLRREYKNSTGNVFCTVEIQDCCLMKEISDIELEEMYKKLFESGCIWLDKDKKNIGFLKKTNQRKIPKEEDGFDYDDIIETDVNLNVGDMVIIDSDLILSPKKCQERHSVYNVVSNCPEISIVVDCQKNQDLEKVLNSILNQTYNNYEIIFINVNPENIKTIDNYIKYDNRITKSSIPSSNNIYFFDFQYFSNTYYLEEEKNKYISLKKVLKKNEKKK